MAIAFDATSNSGLSTANPTTWSHTVGAGLSNSILVVGTGTRAGGAVTAVTYGGVSLTKVREEAASGLTISGLWYLLSPAAGAATVSVTFTSAPSGVICGACSFSGVDQTNPVDANNGTSSATNPPSVAITTVADNAWIMDVVAHRTTNTDNDTMVAHTNRTQRWNIASSGNNMCGEGSTLGPATPAGSFTMDWTAGANTTNWSESVVSLKPFIASAGLFSTRIALVGAGI